MTPISNTTHPASVVVADAERAHVSIDDSTRLPSAGSCGQVTLFVERQGRDWENRTIYRYEIAGVWNGGQVYDDGMDLHTGVGLDHGPRDMLGTLISFLTACAESSPDSENTHLFPAGVAEWAQVHSDELTVIAFEIEESR